MTPKGRYRTNADGEYVIEPDEAKVVGLVFTLYCKGYTLRQLSAELKKRGIATPRSRNHWSIAVLGAMLRNDIYLGIYRFHKSKHGKDVDGSRYIIHRKDQIVVGTEKKPNHPAIISRQVFDLAQEKLATNRHKNSTRLHLATGLLRCPMCQSAMNAKYSTCSRREKRRVVKYACSKKPECASKRILVVETNDTLWRALVQLLVHPERIQSLMIPATNSDLDTLKKQLVATERDLTTLKGKQERLLNLYLEGNIPQASYVVKSSEMESEANRFSQEQAELQQRISSHGKQNLTSDLVQTLRLLARSHRRFTEEQKTKVFRSIVKLARITPTGVELEMYIQPTQNVWWKYRQVSRKGNDARNATVRVGIPQPDRVDSSVYTMAEAAKMLGIRPDALRWRIRTRKYPNASTGSSTRRLFTVQDIQKLRSMG